MRCPKCDAELADGQKVCVMCGAFTPASGYFYKDEKKFISEKNARILKVSICGLVVLAILYFTLRIIPPDVVAKDWINALYNRSLVKARKMTTEQFIMDLDERMSDIRDLSDILYMDNSSDISIKSSEAQYTDSSLAIVDVYIQNNNGVNIRNIQLELKKENRKWKINRIISGL